MKDFMGREFGSIKDAVETYIDGRDHSKGIAETALSTADNAGLCVANLVELLMSKGVISEDEVENKVLEGLYA